MMRTISRSSPLLSTIAFLASTQAACSQPVDVFAKSLDGEYSALVAQVSGTINALPISPTSDLPDGHGCSFAYWTFDFTLPSTDPVQDFAGQSGIAVAWYHCGPPAPPPPVPPPPPAPPEIEVRVLNEVDHSPRFGGDPALESASPPVFQGRCEGTPCTFSMLRDGSALESITAPAHLQFNDQTHVFKKWWIVFPQPEVRFGRALDISEIEYTLVIAVYGPRGPRAPIPLPDVRVLIDLRLLPFMLEDSCLALLGDPNLCHLLDTKNILVNFEGLRDIQVELTTEHGEVVAAAVPDASGLIKSLKLSPALVRKAGGIDSMRVRFSQSRPAYRIPEAQARRYVSIRAYPEMDTEVERPAR